METKVVVNITDQLYSIFGDALSLFNSYNERILTQQYMFQKE